jgi:hypothetical protein
VPRRSGALPARAAAAPSAASSHPDTRRVRLVFVDDGAYHRETLTLPVQDIGRYERLIDYLREDPALLGRVYVDVARLCAAWVVENGDE